MSGVRPDHERRPGLVPDPPTLVEFLRARLDEDEQVARAAGSRADGSHRWLPGAANADGVRTEAGTPVTRFSWAHEMEHIARHDPARVLAEVEAKRRIIEHVVSELADHGGSNPWWYADRLEPILELLALPWAGHPDYREEWRP